METPKKKGKGYYMKTLDKKKASKVMQARAFDRWNNASRADRKALGVSLALARKAKHQKVLDIIKEI